jgi:hypothetical protein
VRCSADANENSNRMDFRVTAPCDFQLGEVVANPFVHVELNSPDPKQAKEFYSKLFQWQLEEVPNHAVQRARIP